MQLRFLYFVLSLLIVGCNKSNTNTANDYNIYVTVYNSIPKKIPFLNDSNKYIYHKYDIYYKTINFNLVEINKYFKNVKTREDYVLNKLDQQIFNDLIKSKSELFLKNDLLNKIDNQSNFIKIKPYSQKESKNIERKGTLTFSNIYYNQNKTKAYLILGTYRAKLDSDLTAYILKINNDGWEIMYVNNLSKS